MSTDITTVLHPVYLIRAYAWDLLQANMGDVWSADHYGGRVPLVPVAEDPEFSDYDWPHIVYGYADNSSGRAYEVKTGAVTMAVYDTDFRRLTQTMNILSAAFERQDEAARDLNNYTQKNPAFHGIRFGTVELGFVDGGSPEQTEGGRQSALINIRYLYFVDYNVVTAL